jgi:hypothetical protein
MKRQPTTPGAQALADARKQAAKELRLPATDPRVHQLAALIVAHNAIQVRIAAGAEFSVSELMQLDGALQEARRKFRPLELKVDLQIAEGVVGVYRCQKCGHENHINDYTPQPEPAPSRPRYSPTIDGEVLRPHSAPPKVLPSSASSTTASGQRIEGKLSDAKAQSAVTIVEQPLRGYCRSL